MSLSTDTIILRLLIGALIGLIVGLEREKSLQINNETNSIGIRSNILIGIFGGISVYFNQLFSPGIFLIALLTTILISLIPIFIRNGNNTPISYKSSISFVLVFLMGGIAFLGEIKIALTIAVIITFVLSIKYSLHKFIQTINYSEIIDALTFIIIAFIILPFLPNQAYDQHIIDSIFPNNSINVEQHITNQTTLITESNNLSSNIYNLKTDILNPYSIWFLVVLISGINFFGYILVKLFGQNNAYSLTGVIGGLYSSSATSLHLAINSKKNKKIIFPYSSGIVLACGSSLIKLFILIHTINSEFSLIILPSLACMFIYLYLSGIIQRYIGKKHRKRKKNNSNEEIQSPLNLKNAIQLTLLIILAMIVANITLHFANINYYYLFSGFIALFTIDDPVIISTTDLVGKTFDAMTAKNLILITIYINYLQKIGTVFAFGNRKIIKPLAYTFSGLLLVTILCILYL